MQKGLIKVQISYQDKERFKKTIEKKKKRYAGFCSRYEKLNEEINNIQAEYDMRIGTLLRKINMLDFEIERYRKAQVLVKKGIHISEALEEVEREIKKRHEQEKEDAWDYFDLEYTKDMSFDEKEKTLRKLWKKLAQKYHPDLTDEKNEKKQREHFMKQINNAYAQKDFDKLKALEEKELQEEMPDGMDATSLEKVIVDLENAMIRIENAIEMLKKSQWYSWRKKSQEEKNSLLSDLESSFIREIVRKEFTLSSLKKSVK